jgi:hypothetical protein
MAPTKRHHRRAAGDELSALLVDKADDLLSRLLDRVLPPAPPRAPVIHAHRSERAVNARPIGARPRSSSSGGGGTGGTAATAQQPPDASPRDPYRVLGLGPTATADDVRRRLRELASIFHPDKPHGSADKMAEITEAATALLARLR